MTDFAEPFASHEPPPASPFGYVWPIARRICCRRALSAAVGERGRSAVQRVMRYSFVFIAIAAGCTLGQQHPHSVKLTSGSVPEQYGDTFEWQRHSATEFLELLKTRYRPGTRISSYPVHGVHHDWIQDADIGPLIASIGSETPCAFVVSTAYSGMVSGHSTVGHEAAYLIEGYRRRFYPHELSSDKWQPNIEELTHWYNVWSTRNEK